jgi:hypothetical protein
MADRKITQAPVQALRDRCGLPARRCIAALRKHGPAINRTLEALIDEGIVRTSHLDPFLCSKAMYAREQRVGARNAAKGEGGREIAGPQVRRTDAGGHKAHPKTKRPGR